MTLGELLADPVRVVQDSDTVLEIENRPTRRAAITAGGILFAVAMALVAIADGAIGTGIMVIVVTALVGWMILGETIQLTQLRLDRRADQAHLRVTGLKGRNEQTLRLSTLQRAETRTRYGKHAGRATVQLYLVGSAGDGPGETAVPMGRADPEDVIRLATLITDWLGRPQPGARP